MVAEKHSTDSEKQPMSNGNAPAKDDPDKKSKTEELSEEDQLLREEIVMLMDRLKEPKQELYLPALESLRALIRSSTTSMTSVPKPLKFLRPHYEDLKEIYEKIGDSTTKRFCADIISVLSMTYEGTDDCLKYRLLGSKEEIGSWGNEYVRHLGSAAVSEVHDIETTPTKNETDEARKREMYNLICEIVPYHMHHNAEHEACDLLMEIERIDEIGNYVDKQTFDRVCLYLISCVPYVAEPENTTLLKTALKLYRRFDCMADALRCALQLNDVGMIKEVFYSCKEPLMRKQLAYMLGRHQILFEVDLELITDEDEADELNDLLRNGHLNEKFLMLLRELEVREPKLPEDVYKSHLDDSRRAGNVEVAKINLASSFVNGLLNCGLCKDKLLMDEEGKAKSQWLYKNKEKAKMSTVGSLGLIHLWDIDAGLTEVDKYIYSEEDYIRAGALLAIGVLNSGVRHECDPAKNLLMDYVDPDKSLHQRIAAVIGLGLAYAGSDRDDIAQLLLPIFAEDKVPVELLGYACLSLGLICCASCNSEVSSNFLQLLLDKQQHIASKAHGRYVLLGLSLMYLGKQDECDVIAESLQVLDEPLKSIGTMLLDVCAYAGTGNVLRVQKLMHFCSEKMESKEKEESQGDGADQSKSHGRTAGANSSSKPTTSQGSTGKNEPSHKDQCLDQGIAVLGIGLIVMGEDIGGEMSLRLFGDLLRYGSQAIRRSVPLALAILNASNPRMSVMDTLSKLSHDTDSTVAINSSIALGCIGAGTLNARLTNMLRQLAQFHNQNTQSQFAVRIAQGLAHLGKGTLTLSPWHSDRRLMVPVSIAGLLITMFSLIDHDLFFDNEYCLFYLATSIQPRFLITLDTEGQPLTVQVRVGQAVDVVGQAGRPKVITGFATHTTPVLLGFGERAELASNEYIPLTSMLEGFVILKKNPDYED